MARPNLNKVIKQQEKAVDTDINKIDGLVKGRTSQGFKGDTSTVFQNVDDYQSYINPEEKEFKGFDFTSAKDKSRAINQGAVEQVANAAVKFIPNVALEITKQVGNIFDREDYVNSDNEVGNWLSNWAEGQKQGINEEYNVYQENPDKPLDFGDFGWWVQNGSSLAESITAFAAVGYATGGAALAGYKNGANALKALRAIGKGTDTAKASRTLAGITNAVLLNHAEGAGIAANVYNDLYKQKLQEFDNEGIADADTKAKEFAAEKAASVINVNRANILLNLTSAFAFLKVPALTRQARLAPSLAKSGKIALLEGSQEAVEESVNMIAENQARKEDYGASDILDDVVSAKGAENALLGFVGGAGQTALTNGGRKLKIRKDSEGRTSDYIKQTQAYEQQQANKTKLEALTKDGKLSDNTDAFMRTKESLLLIDDIQESLSIQEVSEKGSKEYKDAQTKIEGIQDKMLANQAYDAFDNGNAEHLVNIFEEVKKLTEDEAETKGLDKKTYREQAISAIEYIEDLENGYNVSKNYVNSNNVYQNRSTNSAYKRRKKQLETKLVELQKRVTSDLGDLGVVDYSFENDNVVIGDSEITSGVLKDIEKFDSVKAYKGAATEIKALQTKQTALGEQYLELISSTMQKDIKAKIKASRKKDRAVASANKIREKQATKKAAKRKQTDTLKGEQATTAKDKGTTVTPVVDNADTTDTVTPPISDTTGESIVSTNVQFAPLLKNVNRGLSLAPTLEKKLAGLNAFKQGLVTNPAISQQQGVDGILAQVNNIIQKLEKQVANTEARSEEATASNSVVADKANALVDLLKEADTVAPETDADLAPLTEDEKTKINAQIDALNDLQDSLGDTTDINDFPAVARILSNIVGEDEFMSVFNKFKAVYILTNNKDVKETYIDIFYNKEQKQKVINNENILKNNRLSNEFYSLTETEFESNRKDIIKDFVESQGNTVYSKDILKSSDKIKVINAVNKIAHLDKKYLTSISTKATDKFNVLEFVTAKEELDNTLNSNASDMLLDPAILNEGSEIEFVVLKEQVYDDGTIVTSDGLVIKDGAETQRTPEEVAPIAISYNGEVVSGAFLHTTDWVNEGNIAFGQDVKAQKELLRQIRQTVLAATDQRLKTKITKRNDGWLLKDRQGKQNSVQENLPKVEIAIGRDGMLFNGERSTVQTNNKEIRNGIPYVIIPTNTNRQFGVPVQPNKLKDHPEYIDSIIEAVQIYMTNNPEDTRVSKVFDATELNLTKLSDLQKYVQKFVHTAKLSDNTFEGFKELISTVDDTKSIIRFTGNSIDFGRGLNVADTTRSINRQNIKDKKTLDTYLEKLRNVLSNNTYVSIDKNNIGKDFVLPLITKGDVSIVSKPYNTFAKEHMKTDLYGHTLDNGKTIYTIQSSFEFDTSFALKETAPEVVVEAKPTVENTTTANDNEYDFDIEADEDFDIDDLAPKTLTAEQEAEFKATTPESLILQGISYSDQQTIINHLSANIVKGVVEKQSSADAYGILDTFGNTINNVALPLYKEKLADAMASGNTKAIAAFTKQVTRFENISSQYGKLVNLALNKVKYTNSIAADAQAIDVIQEAIDDEAITFDLESEDGILKEHNNWEDDGVFREDIKSKMSANVKNMFSYIEDAEYDAKGFAKPKKGLLGIKKTIAFDTVVNELTAILAYNNYTSTADVVAPTFDSMLAQLEKWADSKPYFHNILERLDAATASEKNEFVSVMHKHYTHHIYVYNNEKGQSFVNDSDGNSVVNILLDEWYNNIYNSPLVESKEGVTVINKDTVNTIKNNIKDMVTRFKAKENVSVDEVQALFSSMGVELPLDVTKRIVTEGIKYKQHPYSVLALLTNADGVFKVLADRLTTIKGKNVEEHHPFADNSVLRQFARVISKYNPVHFASSFRDVRNRSYYGYSQNKFLIDRFKTLKTDKALLGQLANQPYSSTSNWVTELLDDNSNFKDYFEYFTFDGSSSFDNTSKKLDTMSPAEIESSKLSLFFSSTLKNDKNYIVKLFYPTTSNKSVQYGVQTKGRNWGKLHPTTKNLSVAQLNAIFDSVVLPEILRIQDLQDDPTRHDIKAYADGGTMFNHLPALNGIASLWDIDGTERKLKADVATDPALRHAINVQLHSFINELVNDKLALWDKYGFKVSEKKEDYNDQGQLVSTESNTLRHTGRDVREEAFSFVINYLIGDVNMYQTFITDPAFYFKSNQWKNVLGREGVVDTLIEEGIIEDAEQSKSLKRKDLLNYYTVEDFKQEHDDVFNNVGKRLAADAAPGIDIPDSPDNEFNMAFIADSERPAYLGQYLKALLGDDASDYNSANSTDAQEFTTLQEHLYVMVKQGKIDEGIMKRILAADKKGTKLTDAQKQVLNPMKPVYVNNVWRNGREHRIYVKSSSFPLYRELTKGLELDKLRKAMESQSIDRVAFDSAVKIGKTIESNTIYQDTADDLDNTGKLVDTIDLSNMHRLPRQGFKIQQDTPYDPAKDNINDGTQQIKLITANIKHIEGFKVTGSDESFTGQEIQDKLDIAYQKMFKIQHDNLVNRLGYDSDTGSLNMNALSELLQEEARGRNYSLNDIEGLKLKEGSNGEFEFVVPLWLQGNSSKLESMLNSIVDNKVRKIKPRGKSYILGTSEGFRPIKEGVDSQDEITNTTGIVWDKDWYSRTDGQLQPMVIKDKNNKFYGEKGFDSESSFVQYAEVLVPFKFRDNDGNLLSASDFITEEGFIDTTKLTPELLNVFGFRIPTQYLNSMSAIKIVGFLPKESGDLVLAPADFTVQMGSDFDVDKLYSNSYNTAYDGTTLTKFTSEEDSLKALENEVLDLHFSVLGNPNPEVQKKILKPLDFGQLKNKGEDLIDKVFPHVSSFKKGMGMTEAYQTFKYQNARAGKIGIGVFSNDNTFISSVQGKNIYLQEKVGKGYEESVLELGGRKSNRISEPNVNTKGSKRTKTDVISAFQSLAVDDENEQGLFKLNINKHTFDAIRTLVMSGFEEDVIIYLINQPIVRRHVELAIDAEDSIVPFKEADIFPKLTEDFPASIDSEVAVPNITLDTMYNNLTKEVVDNVTQRHLYNIFAKVTNQGKSIQTIQSAINTHSAGVGKNLFYSSVKEQQLLGLGFNINVANVKNLIGNYFRIQGDIDITKNVVVTADTDEEVNKFLAASLVEWVSTNDELVKADIINRIKDVGYVPVTPVRAGDAHAQEISFIKPTTINGFPSVDALLFNNSLWSKFFPYNTKGIKEVLNDTSRIISSSSVEGDSIATKASKNDMIFKEVKSYITSGKVDLLTEGEIVSERNRLLIDTTDNMSLGTILTSIIKDKGLSNEFINRLQIVPKKAVLPTTISYNAAKAENVDELPISTAIVSMLSNTTKDLGTYNGIPYTPSKLMQDLITYQYITGGVQKSKQFIKYIPLNYLNTLGFYDALNKVDFSVSDDFNQYRFKNQILQHNPDKVRLNKLQTSSLAANYKYTDKGTRIIRSNPTTVLLPPIFSVPYKGAVSGFKLFVYDASSNTHMQKDTLGLNDILEYDTSKDFAETIIAGNKTPVVTEPTVPTTPKDKKDFLQLRQPSTDSEVIYDSSALTNVEYFDLTSQGATKERLGYIMNKIINNSTNAFNSIMAKEVVNNLDRIKDYRFVVSNTLQAKGSFSLKNKTIMINPTQIKTREEFEDIILEEVIHSLTKESIIANNTGEVARLKGLRNVAEVAVKKHITSLGNDANTAFAEVSRKIENGIPLTAFEDTIIYPLINETEFVGRLFKSKKLQEILNDIPSTQTSGKTVLDDIFDFIIKALNAVGLNINRGSALEYSIKDIISLINQAPPTTNIQGEISKANPTYMTKEVVEAKFGLKTESGTNKTLLNANEIATWVNDNVSNLQAVVVNSKVVIENVADLAPATEEEFNKAGALIKSLNNRIATITKNIQKAEAADNFEKSEQLKSILNSLQDRLLETSKSTSLAALHSKGLQDMQEVGSMLNSSVTLEDTLYIRKVIHFWKKGIDLLFDAEDRQSDQLVDLFNELAGQAEKYNDELKVIENKYVNKLIKQYGSDMTVSDIFTHFKDINGMSATTLDISRSGNVLLDSAFLLVKDANVDAIDESKKISKKLESLESNIQPILKRLGSKEPYEVFRQKTKNGKLTGHLVSRYTNNFNKGLNSALRRLNRDNTSHNFINLLEWANKNTKSVNLNYLIPINPLEGQDAIDAETYKEELKAELGATHYAEFIAEQSRLINKYNKNLAAKYRNLVGEYDFKTFKDFTSNKEAVAEYQNWIETHSPYEYYKFLETSIPERHSNTNNFNNANFVNFLPINEKLYDENFKTIENNPDLSAFYKYYNDVITELKEFLPEDTRRDLAYNGVPYLEKSILDLYKDKGMKVGLAPIWDAVRKSVRSVEDSVIIKKNIDPVTDKEERALRIGFSKDKSEAIKNYLNKQTIDYVVKHKEQPSPATILEWKEDITDRLAQDQDYDLAKILRVYALTTLAYKHKSKIEDSILLTQNILNNQKELNRTGTGKVQYDNVTGEVSAKNPEHSFTNTKKQYDSFVDNFYGVLKKEEGKTDQKILTKTEKADKATIKAQLTELEELFNKGEIDGEDYGHYKAVLETQLEEMGGYAVWSKRGDNVLKWVQLVKMGWNLPSSVANIGFGFISNYIEAAGGALYTTKQLTESYRLVGHSVLKNGTFNKFETETAQKIRSVMDNWDVLKDASHELFESPFDVSLHKEFKWLSPYNVTQRTEYVNQAPLLLAMMMNTKIEHEGKTINLWEGYNKKGEWDSEKYGEIPTDKIAPIVKNLRHKVDQLNKMNHGNYDPISVLGIKSHLLGRAISQFRTWMFEGWAVRTEGYKVDPLLGERKGRYRSAADFFKEHGAGTTTKAVLQGLVRSGSFKALLKNADFDQYNTDNLKDVDIANMRKLMSEALMYVGLYTSYLILRSIAEDLDDEEDKKTKFLVNTLINQGSRLKTDIIFYLNPAEFKNLLKDLIPATSVIVDATKFIGSVSDFIQGEDEITTGVNAGGSKLLRDASKALPLGSPIYKTFNYGKQTFDK